jgi:hypothetical protein
MAIENTNVRSVGIAGALRFKDTLGQDLFVIGATTGLPFGNYYANVVNITAAATLAASTNAGYITYCTTDAVVVTLPAVSVSTVGLAFTVMNTASDGGSLLQIKSASAADWLNGGMGAAATTNLVLKNTKATQRKGDMIQLVCSGSTAWFVREVVGTWALAATT